MDVALKNKAETKIWLSPPHMSGNEQRFVQEAFESNWIAPSGPHIAQFEKALTNYTQSKYAVALYSGTSAIHLALKCLNIENGDVVFCSTFTFIATANPIHYENAIPYFIESEKETWNMCPIALESAILKTKANHQKSVAIILVHLYGNPAKMDALKAVANKYNIPIIEDAAEALGSTYHGFPCGSLTEIGILSFNGNKIITTSGGGALLTDNKAFAIKSIYLSTQAKEATLHYEHKNIGYNYRMSNVAAAIGCGQMMVVDERVSQRRNNFEYYKKQFANTSIQFQPEAENTRSNRWLTAVVFENKTKKENVQEALLRQNIECRPLWKPLHSQPIFNNCLYEGNHFSDVLFEKGLCLPSGSNLSEVELNYISKTVIKSL